MAGKTIAAYSVQIGTETGQVTKGYREIKTGAKKMAGQIYTRLFLSQLMPAAFGVVQQSF